MHEAAPEAGSYRDFRGRIFHAGDRVLRTVMPAAVEDFEFVRGTGLVDELVAAGKLVGEQRVDSEVLGPAGRHAAIVLEHPRLPFVSWPYEWSFSQLKAAALLHLDIQLEALERGVAMTDASAFNVQFVGYRPVFIDVLSFRRYTDGEFWDGHRQFCEQFVNPLLLRSHLGIAHNAWLRGVPDGVGAETLAPLLKWRHRLSWQVFTNVILQARLQRGARASDAAIERATQRRLPKIGFEQLLRGLRRWIATLEPRDGASNWGDYASDNSYADSEARAKRDFVARFAADSRPAMLWDLGCNSGEYSAAALAAGARYVVGFDFDHGALENAYARACKERLDFLPLWLDAANPSPSQGWRQAERAGLGERANADALLALALVHHLAIARNIPLLQVIDWLLDLAPQGIIEFVPKSDPMVQRLLRLREDRFDDYSADTLEARLRERGEIIDSAVVSASSRTLYRYRRR